MSSGTFWLEIRWTDPTNFSLAIEKLEVTRAGDLLSPVKPINHYLEDNPDQ